MCTKLCVGVAISLCFEFNVSSSIYRCLDDQRQYVRRGGPQFNEIKKQLNA
jgi:hypothetical protein